MTLDKQFLMLRPASPGDVGTIAEIWQQGWRDGHLGHVPEALVAVRSAPLFRTRALERVDDTVVVDTGDAVAGFVTVIDDEVEQVYVSNERRGTGVGDLLLAEAERLVGAGGHRRAWLAVVGGNARARRFYARNGWTDEGLFDYPADGVTGSVLVPCHRYTKPVARDRTSR
ncbi:GNAT family N-acetyltransferase [Embleya scabrispora]|uniref:GNAT family N-acetyltransferase n=1 Tax=Embleya scabrispora TaxID=159449 RepID=UPI00037BB1C7|nr:GNAT family N-acetyltransferase [Embleya scabrispora]MYS86878.1 GNAT family N-acetyltransferase [Streptomyces sp. SID5474]